MKNHTRRERDFGELAAMQMSEKAQAVYFNAAARCEIYELGHDELRPPYTYDVEILGELHEGLSFEKVETLLTRRDTLLRLIDELQELEAWKVRIADELIDLLDAEAETPRRINHEAFIAFISSAIGELAAPDLGRALGLLSAAAHC